MTQCQFCGETSYYPTGPHNGHPCLLMLREHEARLDLIRRVAMPCTECGVRDGHSGLCSRSMMRTGRGVTELDHCINPDCERGRHTGHCNPPTD